MWFLVVGNEIVSVMILNAVFPLIEFGIFWAMRWYSRWRDSGIIFNCVIKKEKLLKMSTKTYMI